MFAKGTTKQSIEQIILQYSKRGMDLLSQYMEEDFCKQAAEEILSWRGEGERETSATIFLTTGFHVKGFAETDGPPGTAVLAKILAGCGFRVVILTDQDCKGLFDNEGLGEHLFEEHEVETIYIDLSAPYSIYEELLKNYQPVGLISIERCGRNRRGDYENMRGISIRKNTASIDSLFLMAQEQGIPTIGIGDGGNEIGMGNLASIIEEKLSLSPCVVGVDKLILASVSNWGAYGLSSYLTQKQPGLKMPRLDWLSSYMTRIVALGCVDGVLGEPSVSVDGYDISYEYQIYQEVQNR